MALTISKISKWVQHPKFKISISSPSFFSVRFIKKCLVCIFFNQIWPSSYGFEDKRDWKEPKEVNTQSYNLFSLSQIGMLFYLLNSFEQLLSGLWDHICCSFYHFSDMTVPNVLFLKINIGPYVKYIYFFFFQKSRLEWT